MSLHREPGRGADIGRAGDQHPLVERDLSRGGGGPERDVADHGVAERGRDPRQRRARAEEAVPRDRLAQRLGEARHVNQQLAADQPADPVNSSAAPLA